MSDYTNAEILNEVSRIFRARIDPGKEGGTLNTQVEYTQLLDSASLTLLLHNDAIFYVARLVRNSLLSLSLQEIRLVEDTLLALDHLGQIGAPVRDTTILSDANTTLLSLDAAGSVKDRPEAQRFNSQMDRFADLHRKNIVSQVAAQIVRPREEARTIIKTNLDRLKKVHAKLLNSVFALRDLLDEYLSLDVPSKVAATALTNIRANLAELGEKIPSTTDANNIAESRKNVLTALASKTAVKSISGFSDPREVKVQSPTNPVPASLKHTGRVAGVGTPASVLSGQGPWPLPLSAPLVVAVDGAASVSVAVDEILGTALRAQAEEPFDLLAATALQLAKDKLHVLVDPRTFTGTLSSGTVSTATLPSSAGLNFQNLGSLISFPSMTTVSDFAHRAISDLTYLQNGVVTGAVDLGGERWRVTLSSSWGAVGESGTGLAARHVGGYFRTSISDDRWEILEVEDADNAIVSVPILDPTTITPPTGSIQLRGDVPTLATVVTFTPVTSIAAAGLFMIAAAVKTATLDLSPDNTVAGVITSIQKEQADVDTGLSDNVWRLMTLNQHVQVKADPANPTRLLLVPRSRARPAAVVGSTFIRTTTGLTTSVIEESAHAELGLQIGQSTAEHRLSLIDLAEFMEAAVTGLSGSVNSEEIAVGTLSTVQGTAQVTAVELAGVVEVGDRMELAGVELGTFSVVSLSPITLDRDVFLSTEDNVPYRVVRSRAALASANNSKGSSLEIVSGPSELGFPVGVVRGSVPGFEAVDKSGNLLSFTDLVNAGDILDVVGLAGVAIDNVNGTTLGLVSGLPSNVERKAFKVLSSSAVQYGSLVDQLTTFTSSRQLLRKHAFDVDLEALDIALTRALLPGQNFTSNRNQARRIAADLLSILTSSPRRGDEYTADVPTASLDLEGLLLPFLPRQVSEVDSVIDSFLERKYTRAVKLLQTGRIQEFFGTDEETGSFSGAMMQTSRQVVRDLPTQPSTDEEVDAEVNLAVSTTEEVDSEYNLDDSEVISAGRNR